MNEYNIVTPLRKIPARDWPKSRQVTLTNAHCRPRTVDRATLKSSQLYRNCLLVDL